LILNAILPTADRAGYPLHALRRDGRLDSFGAEIPEYRGDLAYLNVRRLAPGEGSTVWAAAVHEYRIELWNDEGTKVREFRRDVEWFRPWDGPARGSPGDVPPNPETHAVWLDGDFLWVMIRVPQQNWRPLPGGRRTAEGGARFVDGQERDLVWDTMIEIIDLRRNEVVATKRFAQFLWHVFNGREIFLYDEDDSGSPLFRVFRPTLRGR
jgi:hypothetical protein